jgi:t-SNARE complex subunit (syntaxin)
MIGMCFREHGKPYLIQRLDPQPKMKEVLENIDVLTNENAKLKYENELLVKELIQTKMDLANKHAENDVLRNKCGSCCQILVYRHSHKRSNLI